MKSTTKADREAVRIHEELKELLLLADCHLYGWDSEHSATGVWRENNRHYEFSRPVLALLRRLRDSGVGATSAALAIAVENADREVQHCFEARARIEALEAALVMSRDAIGGTLEWMDGHTEGPANAMQHHERRLYVVQEVIAALDKPVQP